jgi:hypothetical protein
LCVNEAGTDELRVSDEESVEAGEAVEPATGWSEDIRGDFGIKRDKGGEGEGDDIVRLYAAEGPDITSRRFEEKGIAESG